jgi:hypothetical protein
MLLDCFCVPAGPQSCWFWSVLVATESSLQIALPAALATTNGATILGYKVVVNSTAYSTPLILYPSTSVVSLNTLPGATVFFVQWAARNSMGWSPLSPALVASTLVPAPRITSFVASNTANLDTVFAPGVVMTISFDQDTNMPNNTNALFSFTPTMLSNYTAMWTSARTLALTITDVIGSAPTIGISFVTVAADLYNAPLTSVSAIGSSSGALSGNWGYGYRALVTTTGASNQTYTLLQDGVGASLFVSGITLDVTLLARTMAYTLLYNCTFGTFYLPASGNALSYMSTPQFVSGLQSWLANLWYVCADGMASCCCVWLVWNWFDRSVCPAS